MVCRAGIHVAEIRWHLLPHFTTHNVALRTAIPGLLLQCTLSSWALQKTWISTFRESWNCIILHALKKEINYRKGDLISHQLRIQSLHMMPWHGTASSKIPLLSLTGAQEMIFFQTTVVKILCLVVLKSSGLIDFLLPRCRLFWRLWSVSVTRINDPALSWCSVVQAVRVSLSISLH